MDLEMLASLAHFSRFHFHKIMRAYLRESLGSYIIRVRLDTAASLLIHSTETEKLRYDACASVKRGKAGKSEN
ncbi:MAG: hypothetical protein MUC31_00405 [Bacteroidales bacterium]|jgi:AraC-like DNA-binding protein|nr:hypothetical protein [Bacteroidales bacterium]